MNSFASRIHMYHDGKSNNCILTATSREQFHKATLSSFEETSLCSVTGAQVKIHAI
jgi:hypothetical protein